MSQFMRIEFRFPPLAGRRGKRSCLFIFFPVEEILDRKCSDILRLIFASCHHGLTEINVKKRLLSFFFFFFMVEKRIFFDSFHFWLESQHTVYQNYLN